MAEASSELEGPDFEEGYEAENVRDGEMLLGHAFGEPVLVARRGDDLFAIAATCASNTHRLSRYTPPPSDVSLLKSNSGLISARCH